MADKFANKEVLAKIENLKMRMGSGKKLIIDGVSFQVRKGEVLGLIGESGSGKTVVTSTLTGLNIKVQHIEEGTITVKEQDVTGFDFEDWSDSGLRGKYVSQVFQNPLSSLNPYRTVGSQIMESLMINADDDYTKEDAYEEAIEYLEKVKIHNTDEVMKMYPHQMSGGMNQRIVIVTILATKPELIIFDEPTTALDPLAQAQIIEIIREIKDDLEVGIVFISHDLALVSSIADTIAIMYAGRIVEQGSAEEIIKTPAHPYTWGLLMSMPDFISDTDDKLFSIRGTVPSNIEEVVGDAFAPRNDFALGIDFKQRPERTDLSDTHFVFSWLYDSKAPKFTPPPAILSSWKKNKFTGNGKLAGGTTSTPTKSTSTTAKTTTAKKATTTAAKSTTTKKTTTAAKSTTAKKTTTSTAKKTTTAKPAAKTTTAKK